MLQDVHVEAAQVTLVRRVLALVLVLLVAGWVSASLNALAHVVSIPFFNSNDLPSSFRFQLFVSYPLRAFMLVGTFGVLYRWKRYMLTGKAPWFCRWSLLHMSLWIVILLVLRAVMPHFSYSSPTSPNPISPVVMGLLYGYGTFELVGRCVLWLWWTNVLSGRLFQQLLVGTIWVFYSLLHSLYPVGLVIQLGSDNATPSGRLLIAEFHLRNIEVFAYFYTLFLRPEILWFYFGSPLVQAFCMFLCAVVLQIIYHPWQKNAETNSVSNLSW